MSNNNSNVQSRRKGKRRYIQEDFKNERIDSNLRIRLEGETILSSSTLFVVDVEVEVINITWADLMVIQ